MPLSALSALSAPQCCALPRGTCTDVLKRPSTSVHRVVAVIEDVPLTMGGLHVPDCAVGKTRRSRRGSSDRLSSHAKQGDLVQPSEEYWMQDVLLTSVVPTMASASDHLFGLDAAGLVYQYQSLRWQLSCHCHCSESESHLRQSETTESCHLSNPDGPIQPPVPLPRLQLRLHRRCTCHLQQAVLMGDWPCHAACFTHSYSLVHSRGFGANPAPPT